MDGSIDYWIEGIGSFIQPLSPISSFCVFDVSSSLSCYYENEEKIYSNGGECFIVNTQEFPELQQVSLFPNPTQNHLQLDLSEITIPNLKIRIFSLLGRELQVTPAVSKQIQQVEVQHLPSGVYFLSLEKDGQIIWNSKFSKK